MIKEVSAQCPYCWETIILDVDCSGGSQTYTEDCSVCCQPILVFVTIDGRKVSVDVEAENR